MLVTLLRGDGVRVVVIDPRCALPPGSTVDADDTLAADLTAPTGELIGTLRSADVVVLAVPESVALAAAPDLPGFLSPGALLVDTLSVKTRFARALADLAPDIPALGLNPMFAPDLGMAGRPVAAVTYREGLEVDRFLGSLSGWGAEIVRLAPDQHDRIVVATQALTHAAVLAFGLALAELDVTSDELAATATPPHTVALALLARIGLGNPAVYRDVQAGNPLAGRARDALAVAVSRLSSVVEHGTEADFDALVATTRLPLGDRAAQYGELCAEIFRGLASDRATERGSVRSEVLES
ncbi:prephenate dehydrogenase/arogenate dehydrogenase family protein [Rhodococcus sp. NPDC058481]|uniref:prephenate dehydrogenase/arogenate dehydrogenase family protein n=1 Tax=unclassified Rhodococcus (in: high G+C Gram-positive bacteria) TaxID=192944 RepID=UPI00364FFF60